VVRQPGGAGPLWRSLLFPLRGQRAVELGSGDSDLFGSLREAGLRLERRTGRTEPAGVANYDLILEDLTHRPMRVRTRRVHSLLAGGGRWVVALERGRWVGWTGRRLLHQARREGFDTIDTFYAHPSLRSPRILVPLDRPEAFHYFLRLALGDRVRGHRWLATAARCVCALRLHRMLLPNLIMVARKKK
jgi:hypothetical protein